MRRDRHAGDEYQPRSPYLVGPPIQTVDGFYGRRMQIDSFFENLNRPQLCSTDSWRTPVRQDTLSCVTFFQSENPHRKDPHARIARHLRLRRPARDCYRAHCAAARAGAARHRRSGPDRTGPMLFFREVASAIAVAAPSGKKIRVPKTFRDSASFDTWLAA